MTTPSPHIEQWLRLAERYFAAQTTESEEAELRAFLNTPTAENEAFDELRAVMGYAAAARRRHTPQTGISHATRHGLRHPAWFKNAAAVLLFCLIGTTSVGIYRWRNPDCIAYVEGRRITDSKAVIGQMKRAMHSAMADNAETPTAERQLRDMFSTLETPSTDN